MKLTDAQDASLPTCLEQYGKEAASFQVQRMTSYAENQLAKFSIFKHHQISIRSITQVHSRKLRWSDLLTQWHLSLKHYLITPLESNSQRSRGVSISLIQHFKEIKKLYKPTTLSHRIPTFFLNTNLQYNFDKMWT